MCKTLSTSLSSASRWTTKKGFLKLNEVNELIYAFEDNVNTLKEYKKHLISDIVTGQIKVC